MQRLVHFRKNRAWILAGFLFFAAQSGRSQLTVSIGQNFTGSTFGTHTQAIPADGDGAIGPKHFMEFINGTVCVYNKTNGVSVQRKSNLKFWSDAHVILSQDSGVSDPRVIYDPTVQRWFAAQVDLDTSNPDPTLAQNDFLLAVSATSDPTGQWQGISFQSDPDSGKFADFPTLGLDANAVYIAGDFFDGEDNPLGPGLVSIPKADLLTSTPTVANRKWFGIMDDAVRGQVLQPSICIDGSSSGNILAMGDVGTDSDPHSNIVAFAVQNGGTINPTLTSASSLSVSPYVVPFNSELVVPMFNPTQPDGTTNISANDARFSGNVYAVAGVLYAAHQTWVNNRIAIRWYRINATTRALLESGTIADPNLDLFYPSIAANTNGTVVIGCNGSSINTLVSSFAIAGQTVNGVTTFGSPILLKSGLFDYHGFDEFLAVLQDQPPLSRWGDYSATSVDPSDPTHFWTIQMYPSDSQDDLGYWSTQITEIITVLYPTLSITRSNANAIVSWPTAPTGFNLESRLNLTTGSWTPVAGSFSTNSGRVSFQTPLTNSAVFFRMHKP